MGEFFFEYGLFLAKSLTFVVAIAAVVFVSVVLARVASDSGSGSRVRFFHLNNDREELQDQFTAEVTVKNEAPKQALLGMLKKKNDELKAKDDEAEVSEQIEAVAKEVANDGRVFVIDFDGDVEAKTDGNLSEEIEALLSVARSGEDEVVVNLKSPGGYVHSYGIAAEHLKRLKEAGLKLTVCVDEIAASGGYMMACVADKIVAAPFSTIGSIGVVAGVPNVNGLLKKHGVEYEDFTAGEYKRTVTTMGEITEEGRAKFQKDLETIHEAFKAHVKEHRDHVDVASIATGESWLGRQALEKGLVDEIGTSGRLIAKLMAKRDVYQVRYKRKKELSSQLSRFLVKTASGTIGGVQQSLKHQPKF